MLLHAKCVTFSDPVTTHIIERDEVHLSDASPEAGGVSLEERTQISVSAVRSAARKADNVGAGEQSAGLRSEEGVDQLLNRAQAVSERKQFNHIDPPLRQRLGDLITLQMFNFVKSKPELYGSEYQQKLESRHADSMSRARAFLVEFPATPDRIQTLEACYFPRHQDGNLSDCTLSSFGVLKLGRWIYPSRAARRDGAM